ncbi:ankyrin repeat domain-containing protein [Thermodesulfobacterium sp. TA1]|uniref:ankyrin repeat domain-containing protein n=1 Tax=Thermodesulfobacterium sp. TA1 TaxID=2234087 RepID=UPI00143DE36B|nr:ankyrin repeat domain-containing protein [Thermodesulfobacterium sp. TA1]
MEKGQHRILIITIICAFFAGYFFLFPSVSYSRSNDEIFQRYFVDKGSEMKKGSDNIELMKKYILNQKDVNVRDDNGKTLLHYAAREGDLNMVKILLAKGADINAKDKDGRTPLHDAIAYNFMNEDFIIFLIENGADFNLKDNRGEIPLYGLAFGERDYKKIIEIFEVCLKKGWDIKKSVGANFLNEFLRRKHKEVSLFLLKQGIEFNDESLKIAIIKGYDDIFHILAEKGANLKQKNIIKFTCMADIENVNIIKILIEKGNIPNEEDVDACTFKGHKSAAIFLSDFIQRTQGKKIDIKKRCYLPPLPGTCKGLFEGAYFSNFDKTCHTFVHGGCGGHVVPFDSIEACKKICEGN